jgi:hypothetical protein
MAVADQPAGRLEQLRQGLPDAAAAVTQVIVDNPGQFALIAAGALVAMRAAANIIRPRTPLEALALMVVLQVALPPLAMHAVSRGWLKLKVRDADGCLVPLEIPARAEG